MRTRSESSPEARRLVARLNRAMGLFLLVGLVLAVTAVWTSAFAESAAESAARGTAQMTVTDMLRGAYSPIEFEPESAISPTLPPMTVEEMLRGYLSPVSFDGQ
jgi:uncharacterized membrane protein